MNKLIVIDGHAIMYRAFHALPTLSTKKGEPINAVYGLTSMLLRVIQDLKPTHLVVCFDEKEKTFRHETLPTYQAQRPPMPDDLSPQFEKAKDFLKAAGIPIYSKPGFEADDVIGTIAEKAPLENIDEVVIVTGDRDQLQLVDDKKNIKLFMPVTGISSGKVFGESETMERMGVPPSQIDDYKALVGDPSDNFSGVPGIGPKTAIKLLSEYKSFEDVYKNLQKVDENVRKKLEEGREAGQISYKLATIVRNVPVKIDFSKMKNWKINSSEVLALFSDFGFRTLTERVKVVGSEIDKQKQGKLF